MCCEEEIANIHSLTKRITVSFMFGGRRSVSFSVSLNDSTYIDIDDISNMGHLVEVLREMSSQVRQEGGFDGVTKHASIGHNTVVTIRRFYRASDSEDAPGESWCISLGPISTSLSAYDVSEIISDYETISANEGRIANVAYQLSLNHPMDKAVLAKGRPVTTELM